MPSLLAASLERVGFQAIRCDSGVEFRLELHSLTRTRADSMLQADQAAIAAWRDAG